MNPNRYEIFKYIGFMQSHYVNVISYLDDASLFNVFKKIDFMS